jgi:two-component system, NarL family, nitrate/nitrite response regulator NarL
MPLGSVEHGTLCFENLPKPVDAKPRVYILSDVRLMCEGLSASLAQENSLVVVGSSDLRVSGERLAELCPDVVLVDIAAPGGLSAFLPIGQVLCNVKAVAFAVTEIEQEILACAEAGLSGYISRDSSLPDLVAAVHRAFNGELLCSPRAAAQLFNRVARLSFAPAVTSDHAVLTPREREIVILIGEGLSNKEIAHSLRIGNATVKNHVHSILSKLQLRRRGEVAGWICRSGLHSWPALINQSPSTKFQYQSDRPVAISASNF